MWDAASTLPIGLVKRSTDCHFLTSFASATVNDTRMSSGSWKLSPRPISIREFTLFLPVTKPPAYGVKLKPTNEAHESISWASCRNRNCLLSIEERKR